MASGKRFRLSAWLLRSITDNFALKLFSLVIAIILFSVVRGTGGAEGAHESQRTFFVDVLHSVPEGDDYVLVSDVPPRVRVTLQGGHYLLSSIDLRDLRTNIDLSDPSERFYFFEPGDIEGTPTGVTVVDIDPQSLPLTWDKRIERTVPVQLALSGALPDELQLAAAPSIDPQEVPIAGAQQFLPQSGVSTEPVDLSSLILGRHTIQLRLEPLPAYTEYPAAKQVNVVLEVVPLVRERTFRQLEVSAIGPSGRVRPRRVDVLLKGPPSQVDGLGEEAVIPWVDATDASLTGTSPQPVRVRGIPEGVTVVSVVPAEVLLTVSQR